MQGSAVVRAALARGCRVRALVRDRSRAPHFAFSTQERVEWVAADLEDADALYAASIGVGHAVLQIPTGPADRMAAQARNAAVASVAAGLRFVVLRLAGASRPAPCSESSFVGNWAVENALRRAGLSFAGVRPTMYLDNLLKPSARREIVEEGIFAPPMAACQRIAWTSVDDCARAAILLMERGATGDYRVAGARSLDGHALAAGVAAGLGRPVAYRAQPSAALGAGMGQRIAGKFRYFADHPGEADAMLSRPFASCAALEGFVPTDVEEWVRLHRHAFLGDAA
nr:NAD(P)H-binding protein [Paracidovorax cattleyae]